MHGAQHKHTPNCSSPVTKQTFVFNITNVHNRFVFNIINLTYQIYITNTGLVSSRVSLMSRGEGASLALAGHLASDSATIKILYEVDVLLP